MTLRKTMAPLAACSMSILILAMSQVVWPTLPEASPNAYGCTVWRDVQQGDPGGPEECTSSFHWWTSWSNCEVTPIYAESWSGARGGDAALAIMPWVVPEGSDGAIVAFQFFGNRPLATGGSFSDGTNAKVLWHFDRPVFDFAMTATNLWEPDAASVTPDTPNPVNTNTDASRQWSSQITIPSAGCWRVDLAAEDEDGNPVRGSVTYIVVE